jgi:hypothetical protein
MRKRWLVLALILGLASAETGWLWLTGPLWNRDFRVFCDPLQFSADSRQLLVADGLQVDGPDRPLPRLLWCDSDTGKIVSSVDLACPGPRMSMAVFISPTASTALIMIEKPAKDSDHDAPQERFAYFLHDAKTGSRLCGPVKPAIGKPALSPDGQWAWGRCLDLPPSPVSQAFAVIEMRTGKPVLELREQNGVKPLGLCFAPDSRALAVIGRNATSTSFLQVFALPGGELRRQTELPGRGIQVIQKWVENRIYLQAIALIGQDSEDDPGPPLYCRKVYSFDPQVDSIDGRRIESSVMMRFEHKGERNYTYDGPGWLAHVGIGRYDRTKREEVFDWLTEKIARKHKTRIGSYARVRFLDPDTGELRYEVPARLNTPYLISPDGKRVASRYSDSTVEIWDANPPPRWPWCTGAAAVVAGTTLLYGRWRRRT